MSKMTWERAVGSAARLATVSFIAALAATTSASAEGATKANPAAKVPASYGQTLPQPAWGQPAYGNPYGQPQVAQQMYGQPAWGQPIGARPAFGQPQMPRPMIAPATTSTFSGATTPTPQFPAHAARPLHGQPQFPAHAARAPHGQIPAPQFGQRMPIFSNTQANGITYGPPSYTPPEGFDPKTASASPFPSDWNRQGAWGQQPQFQGRPQMPNLAGAPVYGGYGQRMMPATAGQYAPAEPTYAPAEPLRPNYSAAPATYETAPAAPYQAAPATYESVDVTPAAPVAAPVEAASSYSYEVAPATSATTYVGQSTDLGSSSYTATAAAPANPYEVVIGDQSGTYQAAPAYDPAPAYDAQVSASGYEMTAPAAAYQATTYGGSSYETVTAAPAYETATQYQAAIPSTNYGTTSFSAGNSHFVQVGAFRNVARAERLVRKLQGAGEQPIVTQATVRGKLYHRVRVPAMDKRDAANVQSRIRGLGYYEARMVRG